MTTPKKPIEVAIILSGEAMMIVSENILGVSWL